MTHKVVDELVNFFYASRGRFRNCFGLRCGRVQYGITHREMRLGYELVDSGYRLKCLCAALEHVFESACALRHANESRASNGDEHGGYRHRDKQESALYGEFVHGGTDCNWSLK